MLVQMNTRIDEDVKRQGDTVFAEVGYSPSRVVRALWGYAAAHRADPSAVAHMLRQLEGDDGDDRQSRVEKTKQSTTLVDRLLEAHGLTLKEGVERLSYDELREQALVERATEKGLL